MLIRKQNPQGVDAVIDQMQVKVHNGLLEFFEDTNFKCYARAYKNDGNAEVYLGNREYKEVFIDDTLTAISFFGHDERIEVEEQSTADIHLIMFVNLDKAVDGSGQRMDEEVRMKVIELLGAGIIDSPVTSVEMGVEKALKGYKNTQLKYSDMHPNHVFRVNLTVSYEIKIGACIAANNF